MEEVEQLLERVKLGNDKLNIAWEQIRELSGPEHSEALQRWHEANNELSRLCQNLKGKGFNDCLYKDPVTKKRTRTCIFELPPNDLGCRVCPSIFEYWIDEYAELGRRKEEARAKLLEN